MNPNRTKPFETIAIFAVAVPVLGILMGGVYSLPAISITKERDPWLTFLLAIGLGVTVFGLGLLANAPVLILAGVWLSGIVLLLLARAIYGSLGHNLERFGIVHATTLILTVLVILAMRAGTHM